MLFDIKSKGKTDRKYIWEGINKSLHRMIHMAYKQ